jgi:hypothetical protein
MWRLNRRHAQKRVCRLITSAAPNAQLAGDGAAPGALLCQHSAHSLVEWILLGTCQSEPIQFDWLHA